MDTNNFAFLLPIMLATFGVIFLVMARFRQVSALAWGLGFSFAAMGFISQILPVPFLLQALMANAAFLAAFYCYGEALLVRFDAPLWRGPRILLALLAYGAIITALVGFENLSASLTLSDIGIGILLGVSVFAVLWRATSAIEKALVCVSALVVLESVVRLVVFNFIVTTSQQMQDFPNSEYAYVMQVSASVLALIFALVALGSVMLGTLERYRAAAERDPLTSLLNRRGFDVATAALTPAQRTSGVIISCDIDHFKQINDSFGHASGDQVLAGLADLLLSRLPPSAIVARFGGEEFVLYLPKTTLAEGGALAMTLRMSFNARDWRPVGIARPITASFGVAAPSVTEISLHDTIQRADRALYAAKAGGRDQVMLESGEAYTPGLRVVPFTRPAS